MSHHAVTVILLMIAIAVTLASRSPRGLTPRQRQRNLRWEFAVVLLLTCGILGINLWAGMSWFAGMLLSVLLLSLAGTGYNAFFAAPTQREIAENYIMDRGHCGRCGYDLTGNVSGICPECGWRIPGPEVKRERSWELLWFRPWRISHLHDWRANLQECVCAAVVFLIWTGLAAWWVGWAYCVPPALILIYVIVHGVRIIDYGRRQRDAGRQDETQR